MNFELKLPTHVVFGPGRFSAVHKFVRGLGKRALIVTSRSFINGGARAGVLDELLAQLKKIDVETQVFADIEPNPRTTTVDRAAVLARQFRPRYILALGGGSVMDAAKCVALLTVNEGGIYEYTYRGAGQPMKPFNHALPVVCIPTIAATSSETSRYAVVTNWEEQRKTTVFGDALIASLSIIDPELTYSVPPRQTIDGAFDMITHVLESYLSTTGPSPIQDRISEGIVETVITQLPRVLANPRDEFGRSQLSWCGALALSGVLNGREGGWPAHALEHGLSAVTDVAHGRGLSMILPRLMSFDAVAVPEKITNFNRRIFGAKSLETGLIAYMKEVGAWTNLGELLPPERDTAKVISETVDHAMAVQGIWKLGQEPYLENIRPLFKKDAQDIMRACLA